MNVGTEWLVDAEGCSAELLREIEAARGVCEEVIADLELRVVGEPMWHQFSQPGGVTGLYLLTESHLACHTFPETGLATFNLYCCRPRPAFAWEERLRELLGASRVTVRTATRGSEAAADHDATVANELGGVHEAAGKHESDADREAAGANEVAGNHEAAADNESLEAGDHRRHSFETGFPDSTSTREVSGL